MKKIYLLISLVILLIIAANIYYYLNIYQKQVSFQKSFLSKQTQIAGYDMERYGSQFVSDLNYIPFSEDVTRFFFDEETMVSVSNKLEFFYSKFEDLVTSINLYDNDKHVYSLFKDRRNKYISDEYTSHSQKELLNRDQIRYVNQEYLYYLPVFKDNVVTGNLVVSIDYIKYIESVFEDSYLDSIQWQWLIDLDGNVLYHNLGTNEVKFGRVQDITAEIQEGYQNAMQHYAIVDGREQELISAYYPVFLLRRNFGIVFSLPSEVILKTIINNAIMISIFTVLLLALIIGLFIMYIKAQKKEWENLKESEVALNRIIETLPIGVIIVDERQNIRKVNRSAQALFKDEHEIKEGYKLDDWFFRKSRSDHSGESGTDYLNDVLSFRRNNKEYSLLRREIPLVSKGEKLFLEALVDITDIEKARRQKAIAVKTKSEFLANMSHEIRTPLNGIIGLTENLDKKNLTPKQTEFISSIKKSAELLLSIVDDILTFSKIEAGEMFLEEIPFKLREELKHATKLIAPKAREKKLEFNLMIADNVPDKLIGDPFKIRQIISHLGNNAIKFTSKGTINIKVNLLESKTGRIVLEFIIEDTGIGIPREKLTTIFDSFTQFDPSNSRRFGGTGLGTTLSREMVELLNGEVKAESPSGISSDINFPGSRFTFTIEVYSDERIEKKIPSDKITSYAHINALIIKDNHHKGQNLSDVFNNFGINAKVNFFQEKTINLIESNLENGKERFHLLVLRDSQTFNALDLAEKLYEKKLTENFFIIITSINDRKGNYVRSKKLGVDYYLIEPCDNSELFNIIQDNFNNIKLSLTKGPQLSKLRKDIEILVAEDNLINQKVAQTLFKNLGYEIEIAENGTCVLEMIPQKDYDIIFMDVMMPEMDGWEATRAIRGLGKKMPIVAITADVSDEARQKAMDEGMNDYIPKPVKIDEIKRVLLRWFSETS